MPGFPRLEEAKGEALEAISRDAVDSREEIDTSLPFPVRLSRD